MRRQEKQRRGVAIEIVAAAQDEEEEARDSDSNWRRLIPPFLSVAVYCWWESDVCVSRERGAYNCNDVCIM